MMAGESDTWCRSCLDDRWRQESEVMRLFTPARAEIPGQTSFDIEGED